MLAQINPLPSSHVQASISHWNADAAAHHRCFHVSGHVIGTFQSVNIGKRFRHRVIHRRFEINSHVRIGVFVDRQRCTGVPDKNVQQPNLDLSQFRNGLQNRPRDQVKSATNGWNCQFTLHPVRHLGSYQEEEEKYSETFLRLNRVVTFVPLLSREPLERFILTTEPVS